MGLIKTIFKIIAVFLLITIVAAIVIIQTRGDSKYDYENHLIVNDATRLNPIEVVKVVKPSTSEEISAAIKNSEGPISIGGGRFSMGGQIAYEKSLHFDMRNFNKVLDLDRENKTVTVQTGITWRDLQEYIDPYNLSIKIMQTYSNFTVGGSLSVNVHGRYIGEGPLIESVESIKVILANGEEIKASRGKNREIFYSAIGGYGGIGVITESTLKLEDNEKIERQSQIVKTSEYLGYFKKEIRDNDDVVFHNGDLYPPEYKEVNSVNWIKSNKDLTIKDRLQAKNNGYWLSQNVIEFISDYDIGKSIRYNVIDPIIFSSDKVVWRNWEASYDVAELPQSNEDEAYVLREYFIPVENFTSFIPKMKEIFKNNNVNIINVSIRHAKASPENYLSWARDEVFAFVVYYQQGTDEAAKKAVQKWSTEMIDAVISENGTYYLPYQIFASKEQFLKAYPNSHKFFEVKQNVDPNYRFRNQLWKAHYPSEEKSLNAEIGNIKNYFKNSSNSILSVPEWYLVFNPLEYAEYLESGKPPHEFPFLASLDEYWTLYDRVLSIASARQLQNPNYKIMLQVIGISTTIEYMYKSLYENTVGRLTYWLANGEQTEEDEIYAKAQKAYSDLIYHEAWYKFDFLSWVNRIWSETDFLGPNFIRKIERKLFLTMEFGFKTIYAKLIAFASETTYEPSDGLIYLTANIPQDVLKNLPEEATVIIRSNDLYIISVPRWGKFTEIIPELSSLGLEYVDISGHKRIVVSTISNKAEANPYTNAIKLFDSTFVAGSNMNRNVVEVNINELDEFFIELNNKGHKLEHIYDF